MYNDLETRVRVNQGHRNGPDRSAAYFLLTFHSNHGPISYRFRDKWRFQSKTTILPPPFLGSLLKELVTGTWGPKN